MSWWYRHRVFVSDFRLYPEIHANKMKTSNIISEWLNRIFNEFKNDEFVFMTGKATEPTRGNHYWSMNNANKGFFWVSIRYDFMLAVCALGPERHIHRSFYTPQRMLYVVRLIYICVAFWNDTFFLL